MLHMQVLCCLPYKHLHHPVLRTTVLCWLPHTRHSVAHHGLVLAANHAPLCCVSPSCADCHAHAQRPNCTCFILHLYNMYADSMAAAVCMCYNNTNYLLYHSIKGTSSHMLMYIMYADSKAASARACVCVNVNAHPHML